MGHKDAKKCLPNSANIIPNQLKTKNNSKPKLQSNSSPFHLILNNASGTMGDSMCLASALQYHTDNTDGHLIQV